MWDAVSTRRSLFGSVLIFLVCNVTSHPCRGSAGCRDAAFVSTALRLHRTMGASGLGVPAQAEAASIATDRYNSSPSAFGVSLLIESRFCNFPYPYTSAHFGE